MTRDLSRMTSDLSLVIRDLRVACSHSWLAFRNLGYPKLRNSSDMSRATSGKFAIHDSWFRKLFQIGWHNS